MSISLTKNAVQHILTYLYNNKKDQWLRIGIKNSGCFGMSYIIKIVDNINDDDLIFETQGIKIIIDNKSILYLKGIELDYVKEKFNEGFKFNNPNIKSICGCGESFHT
uniref:Iron-sulfur cluster assembly protein IscA n=1 Tax=Candidatus Aschnera chinzeii TaxID=1485666 RepID=A0AAT9G553_9ENTR|nr:MAG: iron-sulfur cluster assembly protein IscA [Candidatus Aschnera chinzeii]